VLVPRTTVERLGVDNFPGVVLRSRANPATGPPRALDLLSSTPPIVRREDALRAILIGPGQDTIAEYKKSPDGRYLLDLPAWANLPAGHYQIRIWIDGAQKQVLRQIGINTALATANLLDPPHTNYEQLSVAVEPLTPDGEQPARGTTFSTIAQGEKLSLSARTEQIDSTLEFWRKANDNLSPDSSYEVKWKTVFNYAKAMHQAILWKRYDLVPEATRLFETLQGELTASRQRTSWRAKLTDLGISEADITSPLQDLKALGVQRGYVSYALQGDPMNVDELVASLNRVADALIFNREATTSRLDIDGATLRQRLQRLYARLSKLEQPALVEADDGNFYLEPIENEAGHARRPFDRANILSSLDHLITRLEAVEPGATPNVPKRQFDRPERTQTIDQLIQDRASEGLRPGER
jgi:hypothetical protein